MSRRAGGRRGGSGASSAAGSLSSSSARVHGSSSFSGTSARKRLGFGEVVAAPALVLHGRVAHEQVRLGAREGDVEQAQFLVQFGVVFTAYWLGRTPSSAWIRKTVSNSSPFALWIVERMSGGSSLCVPSTSVAVRSSGSSASDSRKRGARALALGDAGEALQVLRALAEVLEVDPLQHGLVVLRGAARSASGSGHVVGAHPRERLAEEADPLGVARRDGRARRARTGRRAASTQSTSSRAVFGPMPSISFSTRFHATTSSGFSATRRCATTSLTCAASVSFSPPNLTNGIRRRSSSTSRSYELLAAAEEHGHPVQRRPLLAQLQQDAGRRTGSASGRRARRRGAGFSPPSRSVYSRLSYFRFARRGRGWRGRGWAASSGSSAPA